MEELELLRDELYKEYERLIDLTPKMPGTVRTLYKGKRIGLLDAICRIDQRIVSAHKSTTDEA